ncbi:unnamed protein product [Mytilus coruscus]|uniref:exodeoxyribonuclease III n=1 Tax=Mytilus coruscus TaxID=42192 RepID=A0A6J8BIJ3_MYTCO|nr:unnamed protein product [Mytilus coruscus]
MVVICSFNCNGLKNVINFENFISIIHDRKFSMVLLQETFWDDAYVNSVKHLYEGDIYCSNSLHGRRGVAVLVNNYLKNKIKCVYKDSDGRFIHITYEEDGQLFNVISLYGPNVNAERVILYNFVKQYTEKLDNLIIGGDFNTSLSMLDRGGKSNHVIDEPCKKLIDLIENNNLYDVWRTRNKSSRIFSWKRICNGELQQSRIYYFLVKKQLSSYVQNVYYNTTSLSDHSFVVMNFNCSNIERGPGLWVLNNTLLCNEEYVRRVKEIISDEKENELYNKDDLMIWWDNLKYKIKRYSQIFSSKMAKENRRDFYRLERQINILCEKVACGVDIDVAKLEGLKLELSAFELDKCRGAVLRSKAIWAVESDKHTKYFLNLEKYKQENNSIKELLNDNNESVYATEGILDIQYKFYKELYSCVDTDNDKMSDLLDSVDTKIDDNDCNFCDADISHEEICKGNKSNVKKIKVQDLMDSQLKYIGRLIDDQYHVLWKDIFKYFASKIYGMQLGLEILYTTIPNCELKCIPMVYQEMCQALYSLGCKIDFQLTVENIYDQPLFCNPKIVLYDKTIIWYDFIRAEHLTENNMIKREITQTQTTSHKTLNRKRNCQKIKYADTIYNPQNATQKTKWSKDKIRRHVT